MAKQGLTYEAFERCVQAIQARGQNLTYAAVEMEIGKVSQDKPSRSTLQKHFHTWHARREVDASIMMEIPDEVEEGFRSMLTKLWRTSQATANQDVEAIRHAANERAETLERELREVCQLSDETAEQLSETAEKLDRANQSIRTLEHELAKRDGEKAALEKQLGEQSEMLKAQAGNFERWMQSQGSGKPVRASRTRGQKGKDDPQE